MHSGSSHGFIHSLIFASAVVGEGELLRCRAKDTVLLKEEKQIVEPETVTVDQQAAETLKFAEYVMTLGRKERKRFESCSLQSPAGNSLCCDQFRISESETHPV